MNIKQDAEFIVFQDDFQYRVEFSKIKSETVSKAKQKTSTSTGSLGIVIPGPHVNYDVETGVLDVPIAKRVDANFGSQGVPGLMYPGLGLSYNETTGELTRDFETSLTFAGLIGYESTEGQIQVPDINDQTGYFYVVADPNYKILSNDWGSSSDKDVNVGDKVIRKYDGDWAILADLSGSLSVFEIISGTEALKVDSTVTQFPVLTIDTAIPATILTFDDGAGNILSTAPGMDGLMSDIDKAKLDNLNILLDEPFVSEITTVLPLTQTNTIINERLYKVELEINKATTTDVGTVKITENSEIEDMIQNPKVTTAKLSERKMISTKQTGQYFLPSNFMYLDPISSLP